MPVMSGFSSSAFRMLRTVRSRLPKRPPSWAAASISAVFRPSRLRPFSQSAMDLALPWSTTFCSSKAML